MIIEMKRTFVIVLLAIASLSPVFANQQTIDSLKEVAKKSEGEEKLMAIYKIGYNYSWLDISKSNIYYRRAVKLAKELNNTEILAKSLANTGANLYKLSKYRNSIDTLLLANSQFEKMKNYKGQAFIYSQIANNYQSLGENDRAANYFVKAFKALDNQNAEEIIKSYPESSHEVKDSLRSYLQIYALVYNDAGLLHYNLDNLPKAREYFNKALRAAEVIDQKFRIAGCYANLAMIHSDLEEFDKALEQYHEALRIVREVKHKDYESSILNNIGNVYAKQENYDKSIQYYRKSYELKMQTGNFEGAVLALINSSQNLIHKGEINKGISELRRVNRLAADNNISKYLQRSYGIMAEAFGNRRQFDSALKYTKLFHTLKDSVYTMEKAEKIEELGLAYETAKKDKRIKLLEKEKEMTETQRTFFIILAVMVAVILVIILFFYRAQKRNNRLLKAKNEQLEQANNQLDKQQKELRELNNTKDKFFSIIAHDLKNPFGLLVSISEMLVESYEDFSETERFGFLKDIKKSSNQIYNLLENLLQWARSQTGRIDFHQDKLPAARLVEEIRSILQPSADKKGVDISSDIGEDIIIYADPNMIQFILRNMISNAIKFTDDGGDIVISARKEDDKVRFNVTDTGVGMSEEVRSGLFKIDQNVRRTGTRDEKGTGLGLIVSKEFIERHGGEISVRSEEGSGSTFSFTIPAE
jgi:signal transduction histidine kinase